MPSFLDLPPELRLQIYDEILTNQAAMRFFEVRASPSKYYDHLRLAHVCRTMHKEVSHHFYVKNGIKVRIDQTAANHDKHHFRDCDYGIPTARPGLTYGDKHFAQWAQNCSEEAIRALRCIRVSVDGYHLFKWGKDFIQTIDDASAWYANLIDLELKDIPTTTFTIDLGQCGVVEETGSARAHAVCIKACKASLQQWVDETKDGGDGDESKLTREHLLALIW